MMVKGYEFSLFNTQCRFTVNIEQRNNVNNNKSLVISCTTQHAALVRNDSFYPTRI